ncbi:FG-GAP repeat domain-containing protein [Streptomyces sp. NPDC001744]|uniref:FG-GAP repeat domain-containing protein n=1 Tax=Streptomyces sp. NPDC001744 TaxID=3364606 RepID=UPI00367E603A
MIVAPRGTDEAQPVPLDSPGTADGVVRHALGDWVASTKPGGGTALSPNGLHPVAVRSAKTGATFPLLDHATSLVPDGGLLAVGGTLAQGEGLYRIALDTATGRPAATLVRTFGQPTALTAVTETPPPAGTVDLDHAGGRVPAGWTFSRFNAKVSLTLAHGFWPDRGDRRQDARRGNDRVPAGLERPVRRRPPGLQRRLHLDDARRARQRHRPGRRAPGRLHGGPRAPPPRLRRQNGSPDVLSRAEDGYLSAYDLRQLRSVKAFQQPYEIQVGGGWNTYDRITSTGNIAGTRDADLVARDRSGVLWFCAGKGTHEAPFAARTRIGGGWQRYQEILGVGDVDGDGRNDVVGEEVAADPAAGSPQTALSLYRGTGRWAGPFATWQHTGSLWSDHQLY